MSNRVSSESFTGIRTEDPPLCVLPFWGQCPPIAVRKCHAAPRVPPASFGRMRHSLRAPPFLEPQHWCTVPRIVWCSRTMKHVWPDVWCYKSLVHQTHTTNHKIRWKCGSMKPRATEVKRGWSLFRPLPTVQKNSSLRSMPLVVAFCRTAYKHTKKWQLRTTQPIEDWKLVTQYLGWNGLPDFWPVLVPSPTPLPSPRTAPPRRPAAPWRLQKLMNPTRFKGLSGCSQADWDTSKNPKCELVTALCLPLEEEVANPSVSRSVSGSPSGRTNPAKGCSQPSL